MSHNKQLNTLQSGVNDAHIIQYRCILSEQYCKVTLGYLPHESANQA